MTSPANRLMLLGTGSGVGKSVITAGLCRVFSRQGIDVAPFKAQNMSNNAGVTVEGGEIGRAQMTQARACGVAPSVLMNPLLLKPLGDGRSEVILNGQPYKTLSWKQLDDHRDKLWEQIFESYSQLANRHDLILIEGAGSALEPNLRHRDLVNLPLARKIDAPVLLITDIRRGGAFAWLTGTMELMDQPDRDRVRGFLINKFEGDRDALSGAEDHIPEPHRRPVLGMLPYQSQQSLPQEDSLGAEILEQPASTDNPIRVGFFRFPHIANYDEFQLLANHPAVESQLISEPLNESLDLIVLPGTRNTIEDLKWFHQSGLADWSKQAHQNDTAVLGVCGGYQMMGESVEDPELIEAQTASVPGLGWFSGRCVFQQPKISRTDQYSVTINGKSEPLEVNGYQIRYGRIHGPGNSTWVNPKQQAAHDLLGRRNERQLGTAVHGLFEDARVVEQLLRWTRPNQTDKKLEPVDHLDDWADTLEQFVDVDSILSIARSRSK